MEDYSNEQDIYKLANNSTIVGFKDSTSDTWDNTKYNNITINFVRFDDNSAYLKIPVWVDAEEIRAVCRSIISGNFTKINFPGGDRGKYVSYGGSQSKGLAKKRKDGKLVNIIKNAPESRIFTIEFGKDGSFYLKANAFKGRITGKGAIKKQGETIAKAYYKADQLTMLTTASAILSYLNARQVLSVSKYQKQLNKGEK